MATCAVPTSLVVTVLKVGPGLQVVAHLDTYSVSEDAVILTLTVPFGDRLAVSLALFVAATNCALMVAPRKGIVSVRGLSVLPSFQLTNTQPLKGIAEICCCEPTG